jgi:hypothetical protein
VFAPAAYGLTVSRCGKDGWISTNCNTRSNILLMLHNREMGKVDLFISMGTLSYNRQMWGTTNHLAWPDMH